MNSKVIYTIKADPNKLGDKPNYKDPWVGVDIDDWSAMPLDRMRLYADRVKADLIVVDESRAENMSLPSALTSFQVANMLKFYILDDFLNKKYERMLFLDLDVLIRKDAENIFEEITSNGFHLTINKNELDDRTYKELIHRHYFEYGRVPPKVFKSPVYNGGVIYADRPSVAKLCKELPDLMNWGNFFEDHDLTLNPSFGAGEMNEQHIISCFLSLHGLKVNILDDKWNMGLFYQEPDSNFVHYFGVAGKEILNKLNKRNENGCSGNLCFYD